MRRIVTLFLLVLGLGEAAPASLIVSEASTGNGVSFAGEVSEGLALGAGGLGRRADRLDFAEGGVSASLQYELVTPDGPGSGFAVFNLVRARVPLGGDTQAFAEAGFSIVFTVDQTQDYRLYARDINLGQRSLDGVVAFRNDTSGTDLFRTFFDDLQLFEATFTLEAGHVYSWMAHGTGSLDPAFESELGKAFTFRLSAVPEPSTLALAAMGAAGGGMIALRRRRRNS